MTNQLKTAGGLIGAGFFGALVALSVAADGPKPPAEIPKPPTVSPHYSVQFMIPFGVVIVDNQTNKLYTYAEANGTFVLKMSADLTETGNDKIKQNLKN